MGKKLYLNQTTESARYWGPKVLNDFRASGEDSYTFDTSLTNSDRGFIHHMCRQMGLRSKSSGSKEERRLTIFKRGPSVSCSWKWAERSGKKSNGKVKGKGDGSGKKLKPVSFPTEAKPVLQELFTRYPPCDGDTTGTSLGVYTGHFGNKRKWKDDFFEKPQLNKNDFVEKAKSLSSRLAYDKGYQEILKGRSKLPIASFRDAIISAVEANQVVLIAGETGCGKTTQVPQYLLDHMWYSKQESCKIICTQPRRISAISVSERLSWERSEAIGNNIGYKVRLQSRGGRHTSVVFCTNGILLRVLVGKGGGSYVPDITHIIVDEIHERDCYSDFMLAIIREFLPSNPHLRLILMSATLDAERFSGYFGGCPVVRVPGFTYPVRTFYLEDVLSVMKSNKNNHIIPVGSNIADGKCYIKDDKKVALDEAIDLAWTNDDFEALLDLVFSEESHDVYNYRQSSTWLTPLMVFAGKGRVSDVCKLLSLGADCKLKSKEGITALELAEKENQSEAAQLIREYVDNSQSNSQQAQDLLDKYMATINSEEVDVGLITCLMRKICGDSEVGAILVFLPGWEEISKTKEKLLATPYFADRAKFSIICLHSRVPVEEQKKVFNRPPQGCRKIVLATNIAESAVTIDDVVYVIDSGRMKEKSYDPYNDVSTLQSSWVSKANAKQREGRAGRCQPGICYHLYSKLRASSLPEFRVPEVRRMPVDELCLQVKMLDPSCNVNDFLQKLMDPPVDQSIANALTTLKDIGALTPQEELTELGHKFGQLPVHPRISKMLYFAILVNCLDPAIILACASDTKDPFTMPLEPGERKKASAAKLELASLYGSHSDHLATVAAFYCWKNAKISGQANNFCSRYFVSPNGMKMLDNMHDKLQGELIRFGLIPRIDSNCSLNAHDPGILRAVLAVGLYPMVGRMCPTSMNNKRSLVETITGAKVRLLSNSYNMSSRKDDEALIVFDEITQGDWDVHIRSCTALSTIPLLLFSGEIAVCPTDSSDADKSDDEEDLEIENMMDIDNADARPGEKIMLSPENSVKVVVDRWLPFKITAFEIAQLYILRERLMASILFKVKHPQENLPARLGASMYAIACILSYDGLSKPSVQTVGVEPIVAEPTGLSDVISSSIPTGSQENDPITTPIGSKLESANGSRSGNMEESLPSNLTDGNEQPGPNTAPMEAVSAPHQQKKQSRSKKCKTVNNVDPGNMVDNMSMDLANGIEQSDPNTAPAEADSAVKEPEKKRSRSKKQKSANKPDLSNIEESLPSNLAEENEQPGANKPGLAKMEESLPCNLTDGNEEPGPNTAPMEAVSAAHQQKKQSSSEKCNSVNNVDPRNMEDIRSSDLANGIEQSDPKNAPVEAGSDVKEPKKKRSRSKKQKSANNPDLGNIEESLPSNLAEENEQPDANKPGLAKMEVSLPSNLTEGNKQPGPNTAPREVVSAAQQQIKQTSSEKCKSVKNEDPGNMEDNRSSDLANGIEQSDPKNTPVEAGSAVKEPKKKRSRSKKQKSANKPNLGNIEESLPSNLAEENEQPDANKPGLAKMEESLPSNLTEGNKQPDPNTAPREVVSAAQQQIKQTSSEKCKSVKNEDPGNMEDNRSLDLANGIEQSDPKNAPVEAGSAVKKPKKKRSRSKKRKSANKPGLGNIEENDENEQPDANKPGLAKMEESLPSNLTEGNKQPDPNTAPREVVSAAQQQIKQTSSEKCKSVKNEDPGNMEDNRSLDLANGIEQSDPKNAPVEAGSAVKEPKKKRSRSKKRKSANKPDLGNIEEILPSNLADENEQPDANKPGLAKMEESLPSNLTEGNEQPDLNTAPREVVSAAQQQKKQTSSEKCNSVNNVDPGNMEENSSSDLANGSEQPDTDIAPLEAASVEPHDTNTSPVEAAAEAKQPKKKRSRSKKRKLDNMEEKMPSTNGTEKPTDTDLTKASSEAATEQQ
ncbi:unnamed protein product [Cochlearia groenlandica]